MKYQSETATRSEAKAGKAIVGDSNATSQHKAAMRRPFSANKAHQARHNIALYRTTYKIISTSTRRLITKYARRAG